MKQSPDRVVNLFRKHMFVCEGFYKVDDSKALPAFKLPVSDGEVRAIYYNVQDSLDDLLVFSRTSLWVMKATGPMEIPFKQMENIVRVEGKSIQETSAITVVLTDKREVCVPIRGESGNFRDFFSLQTALMDVIALNSAS